MKDPDIQFFSGGCHEEIGDLATSLTPPREETLDLQRPTNVGSRCLDWLESLERTNELVPFPGGPGREPYLQVTDHRPSQVTRNRQPFNNVSYCRPAKPLQNTRVDQVLQRHASPRSRSCAFASTSNAAEVRRCRLDVASRNAWLTVSLMVFVPSSARAALSCSSSKSTRCFAMMAVYT